MLWLERMLRGWVLSSCTDLLFTEELGSICDELRCAPVVFLKEL